MPRPLQIWLNPVQSVGLTWFSWHQPQAHHVKETRTHELKLFFLPTSASSLLSSWLSFCLIGAPRGSPVFKPILPLFFPESCNSTRGYPQIGPASNPDQESISHYSARLHFTIFSSLHIIPAYFRHIFSLYSSVSASRSWHSLANSYFILLFLVSPLQSMQIFCVSSKCSNHPRVVAPLFLLICHLALGEGGPGEFPELSCPQAIIPSPSVVSLLPLLDHLGLITPSDLVISTMSHTSLIAGF